MTSILRTVLIGSVGLFIVAAGCSKSSTNSAVNDSLANATVAATVTISSTGFSPATVTIATGQTVRFVNSGGSKSWPASDPHPVHSGLPGFDARRGLGNGESYTYTFTQTGTFGYHDHNNPSHTGSIIVQ